MTKIDLSDRIMAMGDEARAAALMILDELSRPLTAREIERALRNHGVVKSRAVLFAASLCKLSIVAVVGGEEQGGSPNLRFREAEGALGVGKSCELPRFVPCAQRSKST